MAIRYGDGSTSATGRTVQTVMFEFNTVLSASSNCIEITFFQIRNFVLVINKPQDKINHDIKN